MERYNINKITVSGVSAGSAMAAQVHVAHSSIISGVGLISGPPYFCASNSLLTASTQCMSQPPKTNEFLDNILNKVSDFKHHSLIDDTDNLKDDRVYIFSGKNDLIVKPEVVELNEKFYKKFMNESLIKRNYDTLATHGMITNFFGGKCDELSVDYFINNCDFNLAFDLLQFLHPEEKFLKPKSEQKVTGRLMEFDQSEFFGDFSQSELVLDKTGFIYVPSVCEESECKLHIVFHGCLQGKFRIGNIFADKTGFNQVADLNKFIILYPQCMNSTSNPNGCFDWWGYSDDNYSTKEGKQIKVIKSMINRLAF
ncbi:unnamed protein product [Brachionus calyciflorus]|uniref:Poly(3-hydroxybutyrate) depolymerase n=1 Tax=Brachionus calyciflorus TaxID=104777 RepID=A0A813NLZ7_9BILA|nr:unnamed protein product [Brachionus calyciflorus]